MTAVLPLLSTTQEAAAGGDSFLFELLKDQQRTAVDAFADWHRQESTPLQARYYRDLMPAAAPGPGQQYAFEVDLDACSGCKACVAACHNLNGLEPDETWRNVGLLIGGTNQLPVLQHVTTACHHCLEPACLDGCPVDAYDKDPVTGIVRHLDDQCIGCQYCILKCPYDVPKYSHSKGIVRKCDMCSGRLAVGEAPACVQSCPTQAIRIAVISQREAAENAEGNLFLPGAPEPGYTLPTTIYRTERALPRNLLPADYYSAAPQHAHWPLIVMLVLTQMSVGALLVDQIVIGTAAAGSLAALTGARGLHVGTALALGLIGLAASILHLGRPWLAYRAIIGWRTSWLSREVLAFGAFAAASTAYAALTWFDMSDGQITLWWQRGLGGAAGLLGLVGVGCSTMIYASTRRPFWNPAYTGVKFLLTCLVLGIPIVLLVQYSGAAWLSGPDVSTTLALTERQLLRWLMVAAALKLVVEGVIFTWLKGRTLTPLRRTARLMTGRLARPTWFRFALGALGGIALPGLLTMLVSRSATDTTIVCLAALLFAVNLAGELLERYLFFAAVVAPKMPGAPSS